MRARYSIEHTPVSYKVPCVTSNATFDQMQYHLIHIGDDGHRRTVKIVRIIRSRDTRPYWTARTDEPRWQDEVTIADCLPLPDAGDATIDYLNRLIRSNAPPLPGQ